MRVRCSAAADEQEDHDDQHDRRAERDQPAPQVDVAAAVASDLSLRLTRARALEQLLVAGRRRLAGSRAGASLRGRPALLWASPSRFDVRSLIGQRDTEIIQREKQIPDGPDGPAGRRDRLVLAHVADVYVRV
jgi:hypothetical protein